MPREEKSHKIEVHVAGICFRETPADIEVLIAKRRSDRQLYPGKWECGGGQVFPGENFQEAIKRQMGEELGVEVEKAIVFGTYEIKVPEMKQKKIPGIKFVCFWKKYLDGKGPKIDSREHEKWQWISINKLSGIDFIPGIGQDIRDGWDFYFNNKKYYQKPLRERSTSEL